MKDSIESLRRFEILRSLDDAELALLARSAEPVALPAGGYLFREGDPGDALYLVTEGLVAAERTIDREAGQVKVLALLPSGSHVGDMALADAGPRSASVRAELATRALRITRATLDALSAESATLAIKLLKALFAETSHRLRATNEELLAVYEVGKLIACASNSKGVAEAILLNLTSRLGAGHGLVALYDPDHNTLKVTHSWGAWVETVEGKALPLSEGLAATAFDEKKPLLVEKLLGLTEPWESPSMLLLPLVVRDKSVGLVVVGERTSALPYSMSDLTLASAVTNISAPVLADAYPLGTA